MPRKSKGVLELRKKRAIEIVRLRNEEKFTWRQIARTLSMDKNNVRRTYLKENRNG